MAPASDAAQPSETELPTLLHVDLGGAEAADVRFWLSYLRVGLGIFAAESAVVLVYLIVTRRPTNELALLAIASAALVASLVPLALARRIASQSWRFGFSLTWTLMSGAALALCARLDGGLDSPLLALMVLPIMYGALGLAPWAVVTCGVAGAAELVFVGVTGPAMAVQSERLLMLLAVFAGVSVLAVVASFSRRRLEARNAELISELLVLAETDGLTGCLNYRAFTQLLDAEIQRALRYDLPLSLLVGDIDRLKSFNDSNGHEAGDVAIRMVGEVLTSTTRSLDAVGRIGGDEFAILLPHTGQADAEATAARVVQTLRMRPEVGVTMSLGVATLDPSAPFAKQLYQAADAAMYRAKGSGRGCFASTGGTIRTPQPTSVGSRHGSPK